MSDNPPEFPDMEPAVLAAIVEFAKSRADWIEMDALVASQHGHDPNSNADQIAGWRFVAEVFAEQL
jgi:hypothetical protein